MTHVAVDLTESDSDDDVAYVSSQMWACTACTFVNSKCEAPVCECCQVSRSVAERTENDGGDGDGYGGDDGGGDGGGKRRSAAASSEEGTISRPREMISHPSEMDGKGASGGRWTCTACTFLNSKSDAPVCEVCSVSRLLAAEWASQREQNTDGGDDDDGGGKRRNRGGAAVASGKEDTPCARPRTKRDRERAVELIAYKRQHEEKPARLRARPPPASPDSVDFVDLQDLHRARRQRSANAAAQDGGNSNAADSLRAREAATMAQNRVLRERLKTGPGGGGGCCVESRAHAAIVQAALRARPSGVRLLEASYVCNPRLVRRFDAMRARLPQHRVVYLFHGTGLQNVESIIEQGFLNRQAQSGGTLIWFSRQSAYSYAFTASTPGKGLAAAPRRGGARPGLGEPAWDPFAPSGVMFLCALLVTRDQSETSNVGDRGQDVITMLHEHACLPCYLLKTHMDINPMNAMMGIMPGFMPQTPSTRPSTPAFSGAGKRLGGD